MRHEISHTTEIGPQASIFQKMKVIRAPYRFEILGSNVEVSRDANNLDS